MLQPNCSELVFWLHEMEPQEVARVLADVASRHPTMPTPTTEHDDRTRYDVFSTQEEVERAKAVVGVAPKKNEYREALFEAKLYSAGIWVSPDVAAIWYHQHCQTEGFPMLYEIEQKLPGGQWEADDGGSIGDYLEWKRRNGLNPRPDEEEYLAGAEDA